MSMVDIICNFGLLLKYVFLFFNHLISYIIYEKEYFNLIITFQKSYNHKCEFANVKPNFLFSRKKWSWTITSAIKQKQKAIKTETVLLI